MKKILILAAVAVLVLVAAVMPAVAAEPAPERGNYVDADKNGVCDNVGDRGTGTCGNDGGEKKQCRYRGGRGCRGC